MLHRPERLGDAERTAMWSCRCCTRCHGLVLAEPRVDDVVPPVGQLFHGGCQHEGARICRVTLHDTLNPEDW
jgi:hypothetical protein